MSLESVFWNEPLWLLLALQPLIFLMLRWLKNRQQLKNYANPKLQPWVLIHKSSSWKKYLLNRNNIYFFAWLCFAVAAAGPRIIEEVPDSDAEHGIDIMAVIDISRSMHASDVSPSRLSRAKQELQSLLPLLQNDRLGLIVYAAHAHQYMPLSYDKNIMQHFLNNLDSLKPPTQGSQAIKALELAEQVLNKQSNRKNKSKAILFISDGEGIEIPATMDTPVFILGMGSIEGDTVPDYNGDWLRDKNRIIVSRLQEELLRKIARKNHGQYSRATRTDSDWEQLYTNGIKTISNRTGLKGTEKIIWHELYAYALFPGILLLLISALSFNAGPSRNIVRKRQSQLSAKTIILILCIISIPIENNAQASDNLSAYQSFNKKDYISSLDKYKRIDGYQGRFGEAASAYRLKDYIHAISSFKQLFLNATNEEQRAAALYNLGNSHFQNGNYAEAVSSYQDSLIYSPQNLSTQKNMVFSQKLHTTVQKRLARLEKLLRPGKGPKQARVEENTLISDDTSVSVDESNDVLEESTNFEINYTAILAEELILKGLEHAKLASEKLSSARGEDNQAKNLQLEISRQQLDVIKDEQGKFWNRIRLSCTAY